MPAAAWSCGRRRRPPRPCVRLASLSTRPAPATTRTAPTRSRDQTRPRRMRLLLLRRGIPRAPAERRRKQRRLGRLDCAQTARRRLLRWVLRRRLLSRAALLLSALFSVCRCPWRVGQRPLLLRPRRARWLVVPASRRTTVTRRGRGGWRDGEGEEGASNESTAPRRGSHTNGTTRPVRLSPGSDARRLASTSSTALIATKTTQT